MKRIRVKKKMSQGDIARAFEIIIMQKYTVNQYFVSNILNWVQEKEIAIPEIQRPFVWNSTKVRDLIDFLYRGFTKIKP